MTHVVASANACRDVSGSTVTTPFPVTHPALILFGALTDGLSQDLAEGAMCGADPELHTGPGASAIESVNEQAAREQVAREVCAECPARALCLNRALALRPTAGVWAGLTATEINRAADFLSVSHLVTEQHGKAA